MKKVKYLVNQDPAAYSQVTPLGQSPYTKSETKPYTVVKSEYDPLEITEFEEDEPSKRARGVFLFAVVSFVSIAFVSLLMNTLNSGLNIDVPDIVVDDPGGPGNSGPRRGIRR